MRIVLLATIIAVLFCAKLEAKPYQAYTNNTFSYGNTSSAQGVAELQASKGYCGHFGGNRGYEGVGFSTTSPDHAIRNCCYWGQKTPIDIGVARGRNGWYACVRYK